MPGFGDLGLPAIDLGPVLGDLPRTLTPVEGDPEIAEGVEAFLDRAQDLATDQPETFARILGQAYGDKLSPQAAADLTRAAANRDLPLPAEIRFVDPAVLQGADGAYSASDGGTVFLSEALRDNPARLSAVLAQEIGHHFDAVLGGADAAGDEGRAFAMGLDKGAPLEAGELALARAITDRGTITVDGQELEVEFAIPAVIIWLGEGAAQTAPDVLIGEILEQLTGVPYGFGDAALDFLLNLIPGAGEAATLKKIAKLSDAIDTIIDGARLADRLPAGVVGKADAMARGIREAFDNFIDAFKGGNLDRAASHWGELIGKVREMQVAGRIADTGGELVDVNRTIRLANGGTREFDVLFREGGALMVAEVKTGARMMDRAGSSSFQRTVDNFVAARDAAADQLGAGYRVFVDDISDDMLEALQSRGIEVIRNGEFLR